MGKAGSAAMRSIRSLSLPSCFMARGRGLRMDADALVQLLPVAAQTHALHEDGFRGHEGQVLHHALADHAG